MKYPGTVEVLPAIEMMPKVPSFLRDTFFPRTKDRTFVTNKVELDYKKENAVWHHLLHHVLAV